MKRLCEDAEILAVKESEVMKGRYYVTARTKNFGEVKFVSTKRYKIGEKVVLQDQKFRTCSEQIRWEIKK